MEGLLDLFECVIESPRHGEYLQEFLKSCTEHQAFYKKKSNLVQPFVSFTNSKLNTPSQRLEGLLLLKTFLPQCSDEQFLDNAISWMHQCVKGIETPKSLETNNAAFVVLKTLLEMASNFQELTKGIANSVNAKFAEQLKFAYKKPQVRLSALQCLQTMIRNYGAPCSPHKAVMESFVLYEADSKDCALVSAASRCFALLPLVGGAGSHGANHKARWLEQQRRTCGTLDRLLDRLFEGVNEVESFQRDHGSEILPLEPVDDPSPVVRIHEAANRLVNVATFLEAMLLSEFPVSKSVLPDTILSIVCRGLSVNCGTLGNKGSSDVLTLGSVLPRIHVALLRVLRSLIACLGKNLYPQAKLICRLILQTLKWTATADRDCSAPRPYATLRAQACRTLAAWLRVAKAGSCVEASADEMVALLLRDVASERAAIKLSMQGGKKNKKRKHNAIADDTALTPQPAGVGTSTRIKLTNPTANDKTCHAALDALYWLVHAAGALVKPTLHKLLQETVLLALFDVQRSTRNDLPVPYSKVECRLSLYRLLQALTLSPHPMWPPPTQFALHVLAQGQSDPCYQVSGFCTVALCSVEKMIHSSSQALQFPVSLEELLKGVDLVPPTSARPGPSVEPDAVSLTSHRSSVHSNGPSCPSPDIAFPSCPSPEIAFPSSDKTRNVITSTTHEDAVSDASTVEFPRSRRVVAEEEQEEEVRVTKVVPDSFSDIEEELSESGRSAKRVRVDEDVVITNDVDESVVIHSETKVVVAEEVKGKLFQRGRLAGSPAPKLLGGGEVAYKVTRFDPVPRFVNLADEEDDGSVVDLSSDDEFHESNISVVSSNSNYQESILNKSGPTDAFLEEEEEEGGGEVAGKVMENGGHAEVEGGDRVVDLEEEDEGTLVIDFEQSNGTAAISPSKRPKTDVNPAEDRADNLEGEEERTLVVDLERSNGTAAVTPSKRPRMDADPAEIRADNLEGEEGTLVVDLERSNGTAAVTPSKRPRMDVDPAEIRADILEGEEEGTLVVDFEQSNGTAAISPSKRPKTDVDPVEGVVDSFEGMSDAEVVKTLLDDFKRKLDE